MEMTNLPPDAPKKAKISLADLPPGTKEGDSVSFHVHSINQSTGVAYVSAVSDTPETPEVPSDSEDAPEATDESGDEGESKDTSLLLGPMNGLKNYLVQKSMDVPKNQGRS